ncbi:MAG: ATP-binding protein [Candidatus Rifleibacteriota bacterium]
MNKYLLIIFIINTNKLLAENSGQSVVVELFDIRALTAIAIFALVIIASFFSQRYINKQRARLNINGKKDQTYNLLMTSGLSTAILDMNLNFHFCNKTFASLLNVTPKKLQGSNFLENFPFNKSGLFYKTLKEIHSSGQAPENPVILGVNLHDQQKIDYILDFFALVRPYKDGNKTYLLIVLAFSRSSKILLDNVVKSIEKKNNDLKRIKEIDKLKSEFLATLSHELKTPLVSIKGYMDLMATEKFGPLTEKQKKALRVSLRNTSHLNALISSILNFARMEAGKLKFDLATQKIDPLINDTIDAMQPIADNNSISIKANLDENLPKIIMDAELIHRVLINLLDNAIKFSPAGNEVFIEACHQDKENVIISVIDHGQGIDKDKLEKIKAPFFQADEPDTRPRGGLGLGLAICEKILTGHGTSLTISLNKDCGTKVSFLLKTSESDSSRKLIY